MKKLFLVLMIAVLSVSLFACGLFSDDKTGSDTTEKYTPDPLSTTTTAKPVQPVDPGRTDADTTNNDPAVTGTDAITTKEPDNTTNPPAVTTDNAVTDPVDPPVTTADPNQGTDPIPNNPQPVANDIHLSGTFEKNLARGLTAYLDYTATQAAGTTELNVTCTFRIKYYTMYKNPSKGTITVNGQDVEFLSEPIDHLEMGDRQEAVIGTGTFKLDHYQGQKVTLNISSDWYYGGVYSNVQIEHITMEGTVVVK